MIYYVDIIQDEIPLDEFLYLYKCKNNNQNQQHNTKIAEKLLGRKIKGVKPGLIRLTVYYPYEDLTRYIC